MTESTIPDIPTAADTDVFITRAFAAPRDVVWRFLTEPELLAQWFGPTGVHVDSASVIVEPRRAGRSSRSRSACTSASTPSPP